MSRPERIQWGELRKYMTKLSLKQPTSHFFLKKNKLYIDNRLDRFFCLLINCWMFQALCLEFGRWWGSGTHCYTSSLIKFDSTSKNEHKTKTEVLEEANHDINAVGLVFNVSMMVISIYATKSCLFPISPFVLQWLFFFFTEPLSLFSFWYIKLQYK